MPYLSNFTCNVLEEVFDVWISKLKFEKLQSFVQNNVFQPETKIVLLGCFRVEFEKILLSYLKAAPLNFAKSKVSCKFFKNFNFWTKIAFFGYFTAAILRNYCHIWNQLPRVCGIAKFHPKRENFKLGTKSALFGYV